MATLRPGVGSCLVMSPSATVVEYSLSWNDGLRPAARSFTMPTYYPPKHPLKGKTSPQTMTFLYGAVETPGSETVYGWVAREALGETQR